MKKNLVKILIDRGVKIPNPESVYISDDVNPELISTQNVTIFAGCKIIGNKSLIMKNSQIGYEAPVTLENTVVGENCKLNGGFFQDTVFAGNNVFGSAAHTRKGTILEEEANAAHTVGLKQTILFPFVTLGSLINFCDCFMAGGTNRKNHSEIGSSFIHFNYTPNQDKATPSMMGNVHQGVMLKSNPIFLGGQGGLVGPVRIGYGCITAAGSIIRKNELKEDRLLLGGAYKEISIPRQFNIYKNISHIFNNNIYYIAGLIALKSWYQYIRPLFIYDDFSKILVTSMQETLDDCINERIFRLNVFCDKLEVSKNNLLSNKNLLPGTNNNKRTNNNKSISNHDNAIENFKLATNLFQTRLDNNAFNLDKYGKQFLEIIQKKIQTNKNNYIKTIQTLEQEECEKGSKWLFNIEHSIVEKLLI